MIGVEGADIEFVERFRGDVEDLSLWRGDGV